VKRFKLSRDPKFLEKLTEVVALSESPQQAMVLCVDEKSRFRRWIARAGPALEERRCGT